MRHGQPRLPPDRRLPAAAMRAWIARYDRAVVYAHAAPEASAALARQAQVLVSSDAPRALSSLAVLGLTASLVDPVFREALLPHARWRWPRLMPGMWAVCFRLAWLLGQARDVEPLAAARARAALAAARLESLAQDGQTLLMGHGIMNRLIGQALAARGWRRHASIGGGYWAAVVYELR